MQIHPSRNNRPAPLGGRSGRRSRRSAGTRPPRRPAAAAAETVESGLPGQQRQRGRLGRAPPPSGISETTGRARHDLTTGRNRSAQLVYPNPTLTLPIARAAGNIFRCIMAFIAACLFTPNTTHSHMQLRSQRGQVVSCASSNIH